MRPPGPRENVSFTLCEDTFRLYTFDGRGIFVFPANDEVDRVSYE